MKELRVIGCRQHNLKEISLTLPKDRLICITGVSGSGKSSLAFDTLYAEGQRRYLEYLSTDIRRLIRQLPKPDVDLIDGLSPSLAVGQGRSSLSSRSTVATHTDIYDFLSLAYSTIGVQHSPITGKKLTRYTRQEMVEAILKDYKKDARIQLIAPVPLHDETLEEAFERLQKMGFIRILVDGKETEDPPTTGSLEVVVDRLVIADDIRDRLSTSIDTALDLSGGTLKVQTGKEGPFRHYTEIYVCPESGISFPPLEPTDFNFRSRRGACPACQGAGGNLKTDDSRLTDSVETLIERFSKREAALYRDVWQALSATEPTREEVLFGSDHKLIITVTVGGKKRQLATQWKGLVAMIDQDLEKNGERSPFYSLDATYWRPCQTCNGSGLKPESLACRIQGKNIYELHTMSVSDLLKELASWNMEGTARIIAEEILPEIIKRLEFLEEVGLGYLELNRMGSTLSVGEKQRVQLASIIGAKLSGMMVVLDEPSLGLHHQDILHLGSVIEALRDLGNTIVVVEHSRQLLSLADHVVELGPGSGAHGGQVTYSGTFKKLVGNEKSVSGPWLAGQEELKPRKGTPPTDSVTLGPVSLHNIQDLTVDIPLNAIVGLCGVSGSGKSTLGIDLLVPALETVLSGGRAPLANFESIEQLIVIDQKSAGIAKYSLPATYIGVMDPIRSLFAKTRLARARGYNPSRFVLTKKGGRCEACQGLGYTQVNMQLMPDLELPCEVCHGRRFNYETLQVSWEGASIADVLEMTVDQAANFFKNIPAIFEKLDLMREMGLEYLTLGQPFATLSGGERQRLKLVAHLAKKPMGQTLYVMDEPSSGLHHRDVAKLSKVLHGLADAGHTILLIEHRLELLAQADHLIELGPGGGPEGGKIIFEGTASKLAKAKTPTGRAVNNS